MLVTPAPLVAIWTEYTLEQGKIQRRLMDLGIELHTQQRLTAIHPGKITTSHTIAARQTDMGCDAARLVNGSPAE